MRKRIEWEWEVLETCWAQKGASPKGTPRTLTPWTTIGTQLPVSMLYA